MTLHFRNSFIKEETLKNKNRFKESIFADTTKIDDILNKTTGYEVSNLWEDYGKNYLGLDYLTLIKFKGKSRNDNRFKDLNISECGLVTKTTCSLFLDSYDQSRSDLLTPFYETLPESYYIHHIIMALMVRLIWFIIGINYFEKGVSGGLYELDTSRLMFYLPRSFKKTESLTNDTLFLALRTYCKYATYFIRISKLVHHVVAKLDRSLSKMVCQIILSRNKRSFC